MRYPRVAYTILETAMRRFLSFVFSVIHFAAKPLIRLDSIIMKFRAAPRWGSLVLGRTIHPTVMCNATRLVKLGQQSSVSSYVVFELGSSLTSSGGQPLIEIGDGSSVGPCTVLCAYGAFIRVGENTHIHSNCHFGAYGKGIIIGKNCLIASHCSMVDTQHVFKDPGIPIVDQSFTSKGIVINDDVWLGSGVVLMDGITVGEGAIIGAGSVVTKDIPPGAIALGVPDRVVRYRSDDRVEVPSRVLGHTTTRA